MNRLIMSIIILFLIFTYVDLNEAKPLIIDDMSPDAIDSFGSRAVYYYLS
jgi:hypothetical protein